MPNPSRTPPSQRNGPEASESSAAPPPLGDTARDLAIRRLARQAHRFPEMDLRPMDESGLNPTDAAFSHALCDAVVRRWLTLSYLLDLRLRVPMAELEPRMAAVLLAGAAQLLLFDRVPAHAAINHAAEWAKVRIRPDAGGLANAVLRRIARMRAEDEGQRVLRPQISLARDELPLADGSALVLTEPYLPESEADRLGVATGLPRPLLDRWNRSFGAEQARTLALHTVGHAPTILNTAHARSPLPEGSPLTPHAAPGHHVFLGTRAELVSLLTARRDIWVQDPASSAPVASVTDLKPALIYDACAGQGTKTRQLAATFPEARIIATDVSEARLRALTGEVADGARIVALPMDAAKRRCRELGGANLVLLDVPCSNTGVLARRPEARYRVSDQIVDSLVGVQRQIIADAIPFVAPGGSILYSTCSLEPEENDAQAQWTARWHNRQISRRRRTLPRGAPGEAPHTWTDGSFSVLLT